MKFKNRIHSIILLAAFTMATACDKNEIAPLQAEVGDQAKIAVINAVPGSPAIDVLANGTKISGTPINFAVRFPAIQYSLLTPGNTAIRTLVNTPAILPALPPSIPFGTELSTNSFNFLTTKNYTVFITGIPGGATSSVVVEDAFPAVTSLKAHVKFVNAMPDGGSMSLLSGILPAGATNPPTSTVLFAGILRNAGTDFVAIDATDAGIVHQLQLRDAGTGANVGLFVNLTALPGRLYTVYARGFNTTYTIPGFTPARTVVAAPGISIFTNR